MKTDTHRWRDSPERYHLGDEEVHVWRIGLKQEDVRLKELWGLLGDDEQHRAHKFHFEKDRVRFVAAHGVLRQLLGRYLDVAPGQLRFTHNAYGKPSLANIEEGGSPLRFNLSHSGEMALCAFTRGREIGVDIELIRDSKFDCEALAERFFSRRETEMLLALPGAERPRGFFNCWTRKEAYIKALGEGLSHPLDAFDVSLAPGDVAALLATHNDPAEAARWNLYELWPAPNYAGALAVEAANLVLTCFSFDD